MSIQYLNSFAHYQDDVTSAGIISTLADSGLTHQFPETGVSMITSVTREFGEPYLKPFGYTNSSASSRNGTRTYFAPVGSAAMVFGFKFRYAANSSDSVGRIIHLSIRQDTTLPAAGTSICKLTLSSAGNMTISSYDDVDVATVQPVSGQENHIEIKTNGSGSAIVYLNGESVLVKTGLLTTSQYWNAGLFCARSSSTSSSGAFTTEFFMRDFYAIRVDETLPNDLIGPNARIVPIKATTTPQAQFIPTVGTNAEVARQGIYPQASYSNYNYGEIGDEDRYGFVSGYTNEQYREFNLPNGSMPDYVTEKADGSISYWRGGTQMYFSTDYGLTFTPCNIGVAQLTAATANNSIAVNDDGAVIVTRLIETGKIAYLPAGGNPTNSADWVIYDLGGSVDYAVTYSDVSWLVMSRTTGVAFISPFESIAWTDTSTGLPATYTMYGLGYAKGRWILYRVQTSTCGIHYMEVGGSSWTNVGVSMGSTPLSYFAFTADRVSGNCVAMSASQVNSFNSDTPGTVTSTGLGVCNGVNGSKNGIHIIAKTAEKLFRVSTSLPTFTSGRTFTAITTSEPVSIFALNDGTLIRRGSDRCWMYGRKAPYTFTDFDTVHAVATRTMARNFGSDAVTIKAPFRNSAGTDANTVTTGVSLPVASVATVNRYSNVNPATGLPWTRTQLNGSTFGVSIE